MSAAAETKLLTFSCLQTPPKRSAETTPNPTKVGAGFVVYLWAKPACAKWLRSENGIQRPGMAGLTQLKNKLILIDVYI